MDNNVENENETKAPLAVFYAYDEHDVKLYAHADGYSVVVIDMKDKLRSLLKYGHNYSTIRKALEDLQNFLIDDCNAFDLPED